jgi:hypothetical protein
MSIARLIALALITASSCTSNVGDGHTRETPASSGGNEEASPLSAPVVSGNVIRCRSVRVPRVELDTNLDREHGLLTVNYTTRTSAMNRSFTIAYNDDPTCLRDTEFRKLFRNVDVCGVHRDPLSARMRRFCSIDGELMASSLLRLP